ncbi:hypothetical protein M3Y94_00017000 [Aphelenchoides besseyi]|nr:hypothetical protein M3Y94_00017000 [Aphelenchoides besseyi]
MSSGRKAPTAKKHSVGKKSRGKRVARNGNKKRREPCKRCDEKEAARDESIECTGISKKADARKHCNDFFNQACSSSQPLGMNKEVQSKMQRCYNCYCESEEVRCQALKEISEECGAHSLKPLQHYNCGH